MSIFELLILAIGLSMDAFAVSICKGLAMKDTDFKKSAIVGLWFGGFQALMPYLGYLIGKQFSDYIDKYDHWIAFILLFLIGANMIREAFSKEEEKVKSTIRFKVMLAMAVATSIDAMAAGITFSFMTLIIPIYMAVLVIGFITFIISMVGVKIGSVFGTRYKAKAELAGGVILILLGLKMLLQGINIM